MLHWIFDRVPDSRAIQGGIPSSYALRSDLFNLDVFVREILQNSYDRRVNSQKVDVRFSFFQLDGTAKTDFLHTINWGQLEPHIRGEPSSSTSMMGARLREGLTALEDIPLTVLRIDDFGTEGLTGGEDEKDGNFNALCRNTMITSEIRQQRGGSFGLGKSVLWRFSSISTVLFSSYLATNSSFQGFRLFGKTELPYHEAESTEWSGNGWFGIPDPTPSRHRAVSAWDEDAEEVARAAHLWRKPEQGPGTTILVIGFTEPGEDDPRQLDQVGRDILASAVRWFWPCMTPPEDRLTVSVAVHRNGSQVYEESARITPEVTPFIEAWSATETANMVTDIGDVGEKLLRFEVPARKESDYDPGHAQIDAEIALRLRLAGSDDSPDQRNKIAIMRGASGMVVKYYQPSRLPSNDRAFHGVILAGLNHGESSADHALENFLRASEPPAHNDWRHDTMRLQEYRRGAKARLEKLWRDIDTAVRELCSEPPPSTTQGPSWLAGMFPLGGRGGATIARERFRVDRVKAHLDDGRWVFEGRVGKHTDDSEPWKFDVSCWLEVETGKGEAIPIASLEANDATIEKDGDQWFCYVPISAKEVTFKGTTEPVNVEGITPSWLQRTRARVEVHPRVGATFSKPLNRAGLR
jgi:hypothetical protein